MHRGISPMRLPKSEFTMADMWKRPTTRTDEPTFGSQSSGPDHRSHERTSTKGVILRKHLLTSAVAMLAVAAVCVGSATAGTAAATAKIVPFTASFSGKAVVTVADSVATISANGPGVGSPLLMGAAKVTGAGTGNTAGVGADNPCVPFTGTGSMTGVKGKLTFKVVPGSQSCGDETGQSFTVAGRAVVLSGTGKLAKAKGTLKLTGTFDRGAGTFTSKFSGKLTLPK
jgi:hypothetical protein